jgi:hypothetical protein
MLSEDPDAELVKRENIIEMALGFTSMMRVFSEGSKAKIRSKLAELFSNLPKIRTPKDYEACHRTFCEWFTREIRTAEKTLRNGKAQMSQAASYGHAAKVLDIAIKVYVYYCAQPDVEVAERLVPFLNGAVDTPIMEHLKSVSTTIRAKTIKEVDQKAYRILQSLVRAESQARKIDPVQYDDIMWRQLSRGHV